MKMEFKSGQSVYFIQGNKVVEGTVRLSQYREYSEDFDENLWGSSDSIYNDRMPITLRTAGAMYFVAGRWFREHQIFHSREQIANFIAHGQYNDIVNGELSKDDALDQIAKETILGRYPAGGPTGPVG